MVGINFAKIKTRLRTMQEFQMFFSEKQIKNQLQQLIYLFQIDFLVKIASHQSGNLEELRCQNSKS